MNHILRCALLAGLLLLPAEAAGVERQLESYVSGEFGYVIAGGRPVIQISHDYGGLTVGQRVELVKERLERIVDNGDFSPGALTIGETRFGVGLYYQGRLLVLADPFSARRFRLSPMGLAGLWKTNLTEVLPELRPNWSVIETFTGFASWYGREFRGRSTASGERFDEERYTAAHRTLPFGTRVRVTNLGNDRSVIVIINDRGPWIKKRLLDLSAAAARSIGLHGVVRVRMEVLREVE